MEYRSLREACDDPDALFSMSRDDLLRIVYREYADEIDRLKRAYSVSGGSISVTSSPSYTLYQENYDEVNRSLVGLLALRWIHRGEYQTLIGSQPTEDQLSKESFDWIRDFYKKVIVDSDALYSLITSIIINDLGKDPQLASEYQESTGLDISSLNHDAILYRACEKGIVPTLNKLSGPYKDDITRAIKLGATLNFGQLAQAENVPVCLSDLLEMKDNPRSLQLRFLDQILDISGGSGHTDFTCAKLLIQPIVDGYRNAYDVCQSVIARNVSLRDAYDLILTRRALLLNGKGFHLLDVKSLNDRALLRLMCMGSVTTLEKAQIFETAWKSLDSPIRDSLLHTLNLDGEKDEPAVQPTHMPAFLKQIQSVKHLAYALQYLSRVLTAAVSESEFVVVIERSMLTLIKEYTTKFDEDPSILEKIDVPSGVVAQTV